MKLEKFKEKNSKKTGIIIFTLFCIALIIFVYFYHSFALFSEKKDFNLINGEIQDLGDIYFAYYIDDEITFTIPKKNAGYYYNKKSYCTNNATLNWDNEVWAASVDFNNVTNPYPMATKCHIYFDNIGNEILFGKYIKSLASTHESELKYDNTTDNNLRYVGNNPNNYVRFNNELWRIIGVFNNVLDGEGQSLSLVKIVRNESIGSWAYRKSMGTRSYNSDWSRSDIVRLLNPGFEDYKIGDYLANNSLYWNHQKGTCANDEMSSCDFTEIGLKDNVKQMIKKVVWPLGGSASMPTTKEEYYKNERSNQVYSGNNPTWEGEIALIYPSDYLYADASTDSANPKNWMDIYGNNTWLLHNSTEVALNVYALNKKSFIQTGYFCGAWANDFLEDIKDIFPTLYLDISVKKVAGDGTESSPYELE